MHTCSHVKHRRSRWVVCIYGHTASGKVVLRRLGNAVNEHGEELVAGDRGAVVAPADGVVVNDCGIVDCVPGACHCNIVGGILSFRKVARP